MRRNAGFLFLCTCCWLGAPTPSTAEVAVSGHLKGRGLVDRLPGSSVLRDIAGEWSASAEIDARLLLGIRSGAWSAAVDYQAFAIAGDSIAIARDLGRDQGPATIGVLDDARRWFDLTHTVRASGDSLLVHRLDRLVLTWTGDRTVVRLGRQALSWGGGLFFSPFDVVNPLDPAAVDTEYKTGDDMLYAQHLRANGDDLQIAWVRRRDPASGRVEFDESTVALKYHGIDGEREYDLLVARNRGRTTIGLGGNTGLGGSVLRADVVLAEGENWNAEVLVNLSRSWTWGGRNMSGAVEYYYNGWGLENGPYDLADVAADAELAERLARGETFTIGRNYLAAGVTIELTPLLLVTPNLFANLDDPSALLQIVANRSLGDNLTVLAAVNVNLGQDGSEFGGISAGRGFLSRDAGLFAQIGWYF